MTKFEKEFLQELKEIKEALVALRQPQFYFTPTYQPPYMPQVFPTLPGTTWINTTNSTPRC